MNEMNLNGFVFHCPVKIYFGHNHLNDVAAELSNYGKRVLLTYGGGSIKRSGLYDKIVSQLKQANIEFFELGGIEPNPSVESVRKGVALCREHQIEALLAVGGGSTIDCTKFIGACYFYSGDAWDIVKQRAPITDCLPIVSVLTLSATGSEMNAGGVISNPKTNEKIGFMDTHLYPKASFLDPELTYTVNAYQTACGSVDILSHIMEIYFSNENDLEMFDTVMEGFMRNVIKYAPIALAQPNNYEARANLMYLSSWALNLFITGSRNPTWIVHAIEHELSAFYNITHGHGLAIVTPHWLNFVLDEKTAPRIKTFACNVFGVDQSLNDMQAAREGIKRLRTFFFETLKLDSTLTALNIGSEHFDEMAYKVAQDGVFPAIKPMSASDISTLYKACL